MTVIELGEVAGVLRPDDPGPASHPRLRRRFAVAAVAVLCVLTVTGSARPQPYGARPLWRLPIGVDDITTLTGDHVYLQQTVTGGARLTSYDLATGTERWSRIAGDAVGSPQVSSAAGLLLLPGDQHTVPLPPGDRNNMAVTYNRETIALDAATGAEAWRYPGDPQVTYHDTTLMASHSADGGLARLRLVRLGDRSTIWERATPGAANLAFASAGDRPDKIVTVTDDGEVTALRFADGVVLGQGRIPWIRPRPQGGYFNDIAPTGDFLVVNRTDSTTATMIVYRLDTLAEVWSIDNINGFTFDCGPAVCVRDGLAMVAYDTATGRVRWRKPDTVSAWPAGGDRLVLADGSDSERSYLLNTATGTPVGEPVRGSAVWDTRPDGSLLLLRTTDSPPDRTSITRWDLATGRQDVLGTMAKLTGYRCEAVARFLTCRRGTAFEVTAVG